MLVTLDYGLKAVAITGSLPGGTLNKLFSAYSPSPPASFVLTLEYTDFKAIIFYAVLTTLRSFSVSVVDFS